MLLDESGEGYAADAAARAQLERDAARRSLLTLSVSGDNTRWVGFEDMPQRYREQRSGPEVRIARDHGNTQVTRPAGTGRRPGSTRLSGRASRLPATRPGSGGALSVPAPGSISTIASGSTRRRAGPSVRPSGHRRLPGDGHEGQRRHAVSPSSGRPSYSPSRRYQNYRCRNQFQTSYLTCGTGAASGRRRVLERRVLCDSGNGGRFVNVVGTHSLKAGDYVTFSGVLGADSADLNNKAFKVAVVGVNMNNFSVISGIDATSKKWDVSSAYVTKLKTTTAANPRPLVSESDWSYEEGDKIYFFVTFNEAVQVTGIPRLLLNTGNHFEAGAADAYATFIGGGFGETKTFGKQRFKLAQEPHGAQLVVRGRVSRQRRGLHHAGSRATPTRSPPRRLRLRHVQRRDQDGEREGPDPPGALLKMGDLVIIQGSPARTRTCSTSSTRSIRGVHGASGNDLFTFIPPLTERR